MFGIYIDTSSSPLVHVVVVGGELDTPIIRITLPIVDNNNKKNITNKFTAHFERFVFSILIKVSNSVFYFDDYFILG